MRVELFVVQVCGCVGWGGMIKCFVTFLMNSTIPVLLSDPLLQPHQSMLRLRRLPAGLLRFVQGRMDDARVSFDGGIGDERIHAACFLKYGGQCDSVLAPMTDEKRAMSSL